eukprot:8628073-Pyramimonas_sp.AAC.1
MRANSLHFPHHAYGTDLSDFRWFAARRRLLHTCGLLVLLGTLASSKAQVGFYGLEMDSEPVKKPCVDKVITDFYGLSTTEPCLTEEEAAAERLA